MQMERQEPGHTATWMYIPPPLHNTHRRHTNLGTHCSRQLCAYTSLLNTYQGFLQWVPTSPSKFRTPSLAVRSTLLYTPSCWFPNPSTCSRSAKLSPFWLMVCSSCFRSNTERSSLPLFLLHPMPYWVSPSIPCS